MCSKEVLKEATLLNHWKNCALTLKDRMKQMEGRSRFSGAELVIGRTQSASPTPDLHQSFSCQFYLEIMRIAQNSRCDCIPKLKAPCKSTEINWKYQMLKIWSFFYKAIDKILLVLINIRFLNAYSWKMLLCFIRTTEKISRIINLWHLYFRCSIYKPLKLKATH